MASWVTPILEQDNAALYKSLNFLSKERNIYCNSWRFKGLKLLNAMPKDLTDKQGVGVDVFKAKQNPRRLSKKLRRWLNHLTHFFHKRQTHVGGYIKHSSFWRFPSVASAIRVG